MCAVAAQAFYVGAPSRIEGVAGHNPVLSPDGTTVLVSADDHTGLTAIDINTNKATKLDASAGAGFAPVFTADGKAVVYRTAALVDGLMNRDVRKASLNGAESVQLNDFNRADIDLAAEAGLSNYATADFGRIITVVNGKKSIVKPIADAHSYLWASLSPDGSHLLFCEPFQGIFVANADGTNPVRVAKRGDYPAWAGNDIIVFTVSHDDGYVILDSSLKAIDLTTDKVYDITPADVKVGESTAANGIVIYTTLEGEIFRLTVK